MLLKIQSIRESFRIIFPPLFSSFVLSRSFHTKIKLNSPIISHYFAFSPSVLPIDNGTLSIDSISTREKYGRKKGKQFILDVKRWCHFIKNPQRKWNNVTTTNAVKISKKKVLLLSFCRFNCSRNVIVTFHWVLITNYLSRKFYRYYSVIFSLWWTTFFLDKFTYDRSS